MGYYLRLIQAFIRTSFQRQTSFRSNFYINLLNTCLNLVSGLAGLSILFGHMESFQGWTYGQALTLLGVFMIVGRLLDINLWPSLNTLGGLDGEIWQGLSTSRCLPSTPSISASGLLRWLTWFWAQCWAGEFLC
jgi:ABC-2 type transport system permease protein